MAPTPPQADASKSKSQAKKQTHEKLPRLEQGSKIQKRPLPRRQQPASSNSHLIYVSTSSPFMAVVERVKKQLERALKSRSSSTKGLSLKSRVERLDRTAGTTEPGHCEVIVLGTGRAIEKTLSVASWFINRGDCHVHVKTKTVGTVDDVVVDDDQDGAGFEDESRVRRVNALEVAISLK